MNKLKNAMEQSGYDFEAPNPEEISAEMLPAIDDFKSRLAAFNALEAPTEEQRQEIIDLDQTCAELFLDLHKVDDDPEVLELQRKAEKAEADKAAAEQKAAEEEQKAAEAEQKASAAEQKAAEAEQKAAERAAKLEEIEAKKKLEADEKLYLLNNKRRLDYDDLAKLGIDVESCPLEFEFQGYVLRKRQMFREYTILSRPQK